MDILAHALWASLPYKFANLKKRAKKFNFWLIAFWGIFPDMLAFTIPFSLMIINLILGKISSFTSPENMEPLTNHANSISNLTGSLYNIGHSIIIFLIVFFLVWLIFRKPKWILGAWLIHIILDILSHSYKFYPTPFLWPISSLKVNGIAWSNKWFMLVNYSLLLIFYCWILIKENKSKRKKLKHKF